MKKNTKPQRPSPVGKSFLHKVAVSFLRSVLFGAVLLLLITLAVSFSEDPNRLILPSGVAAAMLTALAGGFLSAKAHGEKIFAASLTNGMLLLAGMMLLSLLFTDRATGYAPWLALLLHALFLLLSLAGGYLGRKKSGAGKKRRRA